MNTKDMVIKKASALIQTNAKGLTLTQRKLINAFVFIAQENGNQTRYQIPTVKLKEYCGIDMKGNNDLKDQVKKLLGIIIEFNYLNKDKRNKWEVTTLISGAGIEDGNKFIEFELSSFLKEKILQPHMYAPLNILLIANLKSTYAIILYEFLKDYIGVVVPELSLEQFKILLGIEDDKYKVFQNLKTRVIDKAIDEINNKTDIMCSYSLIKTQGNKNSHIKFLVKRNNEFKLLKKLKDDETTLCLSFEPLTLPKEILEILPQKYHVNSIFRLIEPHLDDLDYLISNIEYSNKKYKENYAAYLRLALEKDFAKANREVKEKKNKIVQEKEELIQEQKNQEKLLKEKAWEYFNSLPEADQIKFKSEAEEKMSVSFKTFRPPEEQRNNIINAQIEKDLIMELEQGREM